MSNVIQKVGIDFSYAGIIPTIKVKQYDNVTRILEMYMYEDSEPFNPTGATATVQGTKPDGQTVFNNATVSGNVCSIDITEQMTVAVGTYRLDVVIFGSNNERLGQTAFKLHVDPAAVQNMEIESTAEYLALLNAMSEISDVVTEDELGAEASARESADTSLSNRITALESQSSAYPVGSIYFSSNSTSPASLFGGTWTRIKGRTIVGLNEDDSDFSTVGATGGAKTVTLTTSQIPAHTHTYRRMVNTATMAEQGSYAGVRGYEDGQASGSTGGGQAHENMPPFITYYIWRRTE